jgi:HD-like signal output (HDOD) protein
MVLARKIVEELWFAEDDPEQASDAAAASFAARVAQLEGLKPFPAVAQKVLALLADPNFRTQDVRAAIEEDPALAARVLLVANSAAFAGSTPCDTVGRAIVRLGAATVRDLVIALATMGMFHDVTGRGRILRDHCVSTGALARVLARDLLANPAPGVFLAGLMHDVGKLLMAQSGEFPTLALTPQELEDLELVDGSHALERQHLGYDHAVLGGHAVMLWKIPFPTPQVVAWHHQPTRAAEPDDETLDGMVSVVRLADRLDRVVMSDPPEKRLVKELARCPAAERLGASESQLRDLWSELFLVKAEASAAFR